jgi:hypothetical protein
VRRATALVALAAVALMGACAGNSGSPSLLAAAALDPCRVVTKADATSLFGHAAAQRQDVTGSCEYSWQHAATSSLLDVRIHAGTAQYNEKLFRKIARVPHLGTKAFVHADAARHAVQLRFVAHGRTYSLSYTVRPQHALPAVNTMATRLVALSRRMAARI